LRAAALTARVRKKSDFEGVSASNIEFPFNEDWEFAHLFA
jgi:hypothetical protein